MDALRSLVLGAYKDAAVRAAAPWLPAETQVSAATCMHKGTLAGLHPNPAFLWCFHLSCAPFGWLQAAGEGGQDPLAEAFLQCVRNSGQWQEGFVKVRAR